MTENRKNFGYLMHMARMMQDRGWVPVPPQEVMDMGLFIGLDLDFNLIMRHPDLGRWCYVDLEGTATLLEPTKVRVWDNREQRLTKKELSFKGLWKLLSKPGAKWDPWNEEVVY